MKGGLDQIAAVALFAAACGRMRETARVIASSLGEDPRTARRIAQQLELIRQRDADLQRAHDALEQRSQLLTQTLASAAHSGEEQRTAARTLEERLAELASGCPKTGA